MIRFVSSKLGLGVFTQIRSIYLKPNRQNKIGSELLYKNTRTRLMNLVLLGLVITRTKPKSKLGYEDI